MVVLAIAILLAAALPLALQRVLPARRVTAATDRMLADIRWSQAQAIASGRAAHIETADHGYAIRIGSRTERHVQLAASTSLHVQSGSPATANVVLTLYPDGTSGGGRFELADSGRLTHIEVSLLTGRVRRLP
jgi:Tfp pilus assembly protein FimT